MHVRPAGIKVTTARAVVAAHRGRHSHSWPQEGRQGRPSRPREPREAQKCRACPPRRGMIKRADFSQPEQKEVKVGSGPLPLTVVYAGTRPCFTLDPGFWILDSGFWDSVWDPGFWILDSGFWILGSRVGSPRT